MQQKGHPPIPMYGPSMEPATTLPPPPILPSMHGISAAESVPSMYIPDQGGFHRGKGRGHGRGGRHSSMHPQNFDGPVHVVMMANDGRTPGFVSTQNGVQLSSSSVCFIAQQVIALFSKRPSANVLTLRHETTGDRVGWYVAWLHTVLN